MLTQTKSVDLTELARQGKLDPTIGRDEGMQTVLPNYVGVMAYAIIKK